MKGYRPWMLGACLLAGALSLIQSGLLYPRALGGAHADDALFIRLATSLAEGRWLGSYDEMTLVKGAFYPAFIAASHLVGVPLLVAQQFVSLIASAVTAFVLHRIGLPRSWAAAVFILLVLNPVPWHPDPLRVTREPLYTSLGLLVVALATLILFDRDWRARWGASSAIALGVCFGGYWLTREESVWLYPSLLVLVAVAIFRAERTRASVRPVLILVAIVVAGFSAVAGGVATLNAVHYGSFLTNEVREGDMAHAYGALMRVRQDEPAPRVFFAADAARRAYEVSPAARELEPSLSGERGQSWRRIGCDALKLDPCPTGFGGGWFMWAVRDAVKAAGHMTDAASAQRFYVRLAREINEACAAKRIECSAERSSMMPGMNWTDIMEIPQRTFRAVDLLLHFGWGNVGAPASEGRPEQLAVFERMVGVVSRPPGDSGDLVLDGWVAAPSCVPEPSVIDGGGVTVMRSVNIRAAPDVVSYLEARGQTANARRFTITTGCQGAGCRLVFSGCDNEGAGTPLAELKAGLHPSIESAVVFFDRVERGQVQGTGVASGGWDLLIASSAAWLYSALIMPGFAVGLGLFVFALYRYRALNLALAAVATAALAAVAVRAVLIATIDVTSWDAINLQYMMPAAPFVLVVILVGSYLGWCAFVGRTPTAGKAQS